MTRQKNMWYQILYNVLPVISVAALLVLWFSVATEENSSLPSPVDVARRLVRAMSGPVAKVSMFGHIGISLSRVFSALGIAIATGIPFGIFMGWNMTFRSLLKPIFEIFRPIPPIAWAPLITVWFGVGEGPKILVVFLGVFMPIVVNSYTGITMVPQLNLNVGKVFGASKWQLLYDIILPSSLSAIFAGIRTALSTGWLVLLAAEMISAKSGLGFLIVRGVDANDLSLSIVAMLFIGLAGASFAYGFDYVERLMCPWLKK